MTGFNEHSLLHDIEEKWGAYGAHADLCRWMIKEIEYLRTMVSSLQRQLLDVAVLDKSGGK